MTIENFAERIDRLKEEHRRHFGGGRNFVVNAPYRVCPLGAHVDHQLGHVTGMALEDSVALVFRPNTTGDVRLFSNNFPGILKFPLGEYSRMNDWADYARGACMALSRSHRLHTGIDAVLEGNLPIGGLSSSAAVGVAYILALEHANGIDATSEDNIECDRIIENDFINLNNGILDQSVILLSQKERLLSMDCLDGSNDRIAPGENIPGYEILVVYSGVSKKLIETDYNKRVGECETAARELMHMGGRAAPIGSSVKLRYVKPEEFESHGHALQENLRKRATHFFTEMKRVEEGITAWRSGDLAKFGGLMKESCESSINNYECGCPQLISLAEILNAVPGVYGARFSGAGFRGCCIGLSDPAAREEITAIVKREYPKRHPDFAGSYQVRFCNMGNGAQML